MRWQENTQQRLIRPKSGIERRWGHLGQRIGKGEAGTWAGLEEWVEAVLVKAHSHRLCHPDPNPCPRLLLTNQTWKVAGTFRLGALFWGRKWDGNDNVWYTWTPWPEPVMENSSSSPKQSLQAWPGSSSWHPCFGSWDHKPSELLFADTLFLVLIPKILARHITTFYLYSTFYEGIRTCNICHEKPLHIGTHRDRWSRGGSERDIDLLS